MTCDLLNQKYGCVANFYCVSADSGFVDFADPGSGVLFGNTQSEREYLFTVRQNCGSRVLLIQGDLVFPYSDSNQLLGFGMVSGGANLEWNEIERIQFYMDLVARCVVHGQRISADRLHLELVKETSKTVVSIQDHPEFRGPKMTVVANTVVKPDSHYIVEELDPERVRRFAVDIHEKFARLALLSIDDLSQGKNLTLGEIFDLGSMTIYVPDLVQLPLATQRVIEQYIATQTPLNQAPLFVFGVRPQASREMPEGQRILSELLQLPMVSQIQLPPPGTAASKSSEIYRALMDTRGATRRKHLVSIPENGSDTHLGNLH